MKLLSVAIAVRKYWMIYFGLTIGGYSIFIIEDKIRQ